jgi:hypothetical protein
VYSDNSVGESSFKERGGNSVCIQEVQKMEKCFRGRMITKTEKEINKSHINETD